MVENVSAGGILVLQAVRWELVMKQIQEIKAYVKIPNFYKADYELVKDLESTIGE